MLLHSKVFLGSILSTKKEKKKLPGCIDQCVYQGCFQAARQFKHGYAYLGKDSLACLNRMPYKLHLYTLFKTCSCI